MKKKLLSALLAALLVLSMIPFAFAGTATATEPANVAYLTDGGDDDTAALNDASAPFGSFKAAYNALCPAGGTIKIKGTYGSVDNESINGLSVHYGMITITGNDASAVWLLPAMDTTAASVKNYVIFGGPVTIQGIRLRATQQIDLFANYNKLTMGEEIVCENGTTVLSSGSAAGRISVLGGSRHEFLDGDMDYDFFEDTWITVKSGVYRTVAGGCRVLFNDVTQAGGSAARRALLGTAYVFIEGGTVNFVFGTNWAQNGNVDSSAGGEAYTYVSGGIINNFYFGAQNPAQFAFSDNFLIYTGGHIVGINTTGYVYTGGRALAFYGGSITSTYAYSQVGSAQKNTTVFTNSDTSETTTFKNLQTSVGMQVIPLRTYDPNNTQVVYVGDIDLCNEKEAEKYGLPIATSRSKGTADDPIYSLTAAYVYLTYSGGEIVILGPHYTLKNFELTGAYRYNEPYHEKKITVKGNGHDGEQTKVIGIVPDTRPKTGSGGQSYTMPCGLDVYNLCGDTEFKDIRLSFGTYRSNIAANFHNLVIGDNVSTTKTICLSGGTAWSLASVVKPYAGGTDHKSASSVSFYGPYSRWSDADTNITLSAANIGTWWITGFSRVNSGVNLPSGYYLNYPGTAHVTINGGTIECLYPAPTNKRDATGANAELVVNGGTVKELYDGGYDSPNGAITGNLDITVGENATIQSYRNINTTPASFTMKVNSTYSSYLIAKNTYTQANVTTDITADTYRDSIDAVLGFGLKDNGADGVKIRYGAKLKDYIVDDPDFTVKEFGVLIKNANNATALEWFDSDAQLTYQNKVAKKIAYKAGTEMNYYDYDPANGNDVQFYTTLTGISEARYETEYVFRAYMVVTVNGVDQVVYGAESADSAYTIAQRLTSSNETAAKVIDAVENAGA